MSESGQDEPKQQTFHGAGSFGGNNNGVIHNHVLLDAKTKTLVAKMAQYAPPLAGLLEKAVRDGVMSPTAVEALMLAAQNINEDVAAALLIAGRNINGDVAEQLWYAGKNINQDVADRFTTVNQDLAITVYEINAATDSLRDLLQDAGTRAGTVSPTGGMVSQPVSQPSHLIRDKWRVRVGLMCGSSAAGLVAAMILMRSHLGGQAIFVTVVMVVATVALLVKIRR